MSSLEIVFERQKTSAEGHSQTLTQSDLVFINPGIYLHSMATVIGKSVNTISSLRGRILEHVTAFAGDNYLHSMATVIGKSAKKQFPAYVAEFWSMSQRLLEIIISIVWRQ